MTKKTITIILENGKTMEMESPIDVAIAMARLDKKRAASRKYYQEHKEKVREQQKRYRDENHENVLARIRRWQKTNPEKVRENSKRWRDANPEKVRENNRISNARRKLRKEAEKLGMVVSPAPKA